MFDVKLSSDNEELELELELEVDNFLFLDFEDLDEISLLLSGVFIPLGLLKSVYCFYSFLFNSIVLVDDFGDVVIVVVVVVDFCC